MEDYNDNEKADDQNCILPLGESRIIRSQHFSGDILKNNKEYPHQLGSYFFLWETTISFLSEICALFTLRVVPWPGCPWQHLL